MEDIIDLLLLYVTLVIDIMYVKWGCGLIVSFLKYECEILLIKMLAFYLVTAVNENVLGSLDC